MCSASNTVHTGVVGVGYLFFLVPTGSLYLNKSKSKDRWLRGIEKLGIEESPGPECLNHFKEPSSFVKEPGKNRRLQLGI